MSFCQSIHVCLTTLELGFISTFRIFFFKCVISYSTGLFFFSLFCFYFLAILQVLFEELQLNSKLVGKVKLAKTNVGQETSTSEAVLSQLLPFHPLPAIVLEYRQVSCLEPLIPADFYYKFVL